MRKLVDADLDRPPMTRDPGDTGPARELPTVGISGEIRLPASGRAAFFADLRTTLQDLFARHGGADGEAFRLAVACYPRPADQHEEKEITHE